MLVSPSEAEQHPLYERSSPFNSALELSRGGGNSRCEILLNLTPEFEPEHILLGSYYSR